MLGGAVAGGLPLLRRDSLAARTPLSIRQKVEQLFVISFPGTTVQQQTVSLLNRHAFGGVILYGRNCQSPQQIRLLLAGLQSAARSPLLVCVDQEGGTVTRIQRGVPVLPAEQTYGKLGSAQRVLNDAAASAAALRPLGVTMNLAPVVDVLVNPQSPIGSRSYGSNPALDARLVSAAIRGYQGHGLPATAKHFIGLGHTSIDSHDLLPTVRLTLAQLERADLIPFRAAIAAGVSTILVAHVALPSIDPVYRPASLSPVIIKNVIRRRLGFQRVVMTDSLMMGALPKGQEPAAAERAFAAGADLLLLGWDRDIAPSLIEEAIDRVSAAVTSGRIPEAQLDSSMRRIAALKGSMRL
jgi:beta-N-acetylhexosaminidase